MSLEYRLVEEPAAFSACVTSWARQPRLWIDIEVADYYSRNARVAALQVRDTVGAVTVVDCLRDDMQGRLHLEFVPAVMLNGGVEKWAHNARYEQRFLGSGGVQNLHCTLALAKQLPYYRLPTRSWSLASLVKRLWGEEVDKSYQRFSWGDRPLPAAAWSYAAWDAEWCHRLWAELRAQIAAHEVPKTPEAMAKRFAEFDVDYKVAKERREAIWQAVREFMIGEKQMAFGAFRLNQREHTKIELPVLVACLEKADPHSLVMCPLSLTKRHHEALGDVADEVKRASEVVGGASFRVPTERHKKTFVYDLDRSDPGRVEMDFEDADHKHRILDSERDELKSAIKAIMLAEGRDELLGFTFGDRAGNWRIDPRVLASLAPSRDLGLFPLTSKVKAVFECAKLQIPEIGVERSESWTLRRPQRAPALAHEVESEMFDD